MKKNKTACRPIKKLITIKGINPLFPDSVCSVYAMSTSKGRHYIGALDSAVSISLQPVESFTPAGLPTPKSKWAVFITDHCRKGDKVLRCKIIKSNSTSGAGDVPPNGKLQFPKAFKHMSAVISD